MLIRDAKYLYFIPDTQSISLHILVIYCLKGKSIKHWIALDRESTPGGYHCSLRPEQGSREICHCLCPTCSSNGNDLLMQKPDITIQGWKNCGRNWWIRLGEAVYWTKRTMSDTVECPNWSPNNRKVCTSLWPRIKAMYVSQTCHWHTWFNPGISEKPKIYELLSGVKFCSNVACWLSTRGRKNFYQNV